MRDRFDGYREQLEQIRLTDSGKRALLDSLRKQADEPVRRSPQVLRTALIAVCVCLLLVGTTMAATGGFGIFTRYNEDGTTTREYREKLFSDDELTDEARQNLEKSKQNIEEGDSDPIVREVMGSWREIQERTGIDLIDSALLDGAELANYWTLQSYTVTYFPDVMSIGRSHIIDGVKVSLTAVVRMNGYGGTDGDVYSSEFTDNGPIYAAGATLDDAILQVYKEPYALADGTPVYYHTENWPTGEVYIAAVFIYDGIEYSVTICDAERDKLTAEATEKSLAMQLAGEVIDYDELNAPLKQFQIDPNTDYEGVFFRVLDSFVTDR